jgi:hypothetical protein
MSERNTSIVTADSAVRRLATDECRNGTRVLLMAQLPWAGNVLQDSDSVPKIRKKTAISLFSDLHKRIEVIKQLYYKPFNAGIKSHRAMLSDGIFCGRFCFFNPWISLIYAWKTNQCNNYSFSLLNINGSSYMFRNYVAIFRERS